MGTLTQRSLAQLREKKKVLESRLESLEVEYRGYTRGPTYFSRRDAITSNLQSLEDKLSKFGTEYPLVMVTATQLVPVTGGINVERRMMMFLTGISLSDAIDFVKMKLDVKDIVSKEIPLGVKFKPELENEEFLKF